MLKDVKISSTAIFFSDQIEDERETNEEKDNERLLFRNLVAAEHRKLSVEGIV